MSGKPYARRAKPGRRGQRAGGFSMLIHDYFQSPQYAAMSPRAVKLLIDLLCQYRGNNNGDLCASCKVMVACGWKSKCQLSKALAELESRGWVLRTRQGSVNKASLHAVTFFGIDPCDGKFDAGIRPDPMPLHLWKSPEYMAPVQKSNRKVRKKTHRPDLRAGDPSPSVRGNESSKVVSLPLRAGQS